MKVTCSSCNGTGRRELTAAERDTIKAVTSQWSVTAQIGERLRKIQGYNTTPTALCNRLVELLALGLVKRRPLSGKQYEWSAP